MTSSFEGRAGARNIVRFPDGDGRAFLWSCVPFFPESEIPGSEFDYVLAIHRLSAHFQSLNLPLNAVWQCVELPYQRRLFSVVYSLAIVEVSLHRRGIYLDDDERIHY